MNNLRSLETTVKKNKKDGHNDRLYNIIFDIY